MGEERWVIEWADEGGLTGPFETEQDALDYANKDEATGWKVRPLTDMDEGVRDPI